MSTARSSRFDRTRNLCIAATVRRCWNKPLTDCFAVVKKNSAARRRFCSNSCRQRELGARFGWNSKKWVVTRQCLACDQK